MSHLAEVWSAMCIWTQTREDLDLLEASFWEN
jgi:hypothetical protein